MLFEENREIYFPCHLKSQVFETTIGAFFVNVLIFVGRASVLGYALKTQKRPVNYRILKMGLRRNRQSINPLRKEGLLLEKRKYDRVFSSIFITFFYFLFIFLKFSMISILSLLKSGDNENQDPKKEGEDSVPEIKTERRKSIYRDGQGRLSLRRLSLIMQ